MIPTSLPTSADTASKPHARRAKKLARLRELPLLQRAEGLRAEGLRAEDLRASRLDAPARAPEPNAQPRLLDAVAPGRLVELVGPAGRAAVTSAAAALVSEVQEQAQPVLWVDCTEDLYPPDLAEAGVDLDTLVFVRLSRGQSRDLGADVLEAAEIALRSGAFGMVLVSMPNQPSASLQRGLARLAQLARHHRARVVLLRRAEVAAPSLGSLVSLRIAAQPRGEHQVVFELTKDKVGLQQRPLALAVRPPAGVREHVHSQLELPTPKAPEPIALEPSEAAETSEFQAIPGMKKANTLQEVAASGEGERVHAA